MKVVRDVVVRASGDGWNYKMARMLVDAEGNAAVFVLPGKAPVQRFTVDPKQARAMKGTGVDADGGKVSWSQRASGCGYKLAKCNVKTAVLQARWAKAEKARIADLIASEAEAADDDPDAALPDGVTVTRGHGEAAS